MDTIANLFMFIHPYFITFCMNQGFLVLKGRLVSLLNKNKKKQKKLKWNKLKRKRFTFIEISHKNTSIFIWKSEKEYKEY